MFYIDSVMKKLLIATLVVLVSTITVYAQPRNNDWGARMRSEKIGFLTSEMDLTPEEAQLFWPVYNKAEKEKGEAMAELFKVYGALQEALQKGSGDFGKLVDQYIAAEKMQGEIDLRYAKEYRKVLPDEKIARLFVAEERFRRNQISKLNSSGKWHGQR